jgi:glycosyl hydrolase family 26
VTRVKSRHSTVSKSRAAVAAVIAVFVVIGGAVAVSQAASSGPPNSTSAAGSTASGQQNPGNSQFFQAQQPGADGSPTPGASVSTSISALPTAPGASGAPGTPGGPGQPGGGSGGNPPASGCGSVSAKLVPACGAWLGIWPRTQANGTETTDLASNLSSLEGRLGRKVDIVSRYYGWGQMPPDQTDRAWSASGHLILVDLRARSFSTNQYVSWSSIAAGTQDTYLRQVAASLKSFGSKIFFSFNQEPEQELEKGTGVAGTASDYAAAYRHIHNVFSAAGVTNVVYVWWTMGCTCHLSWYADLYPGDAYVDWVSYDPYNFNSCHSEGNKTASQSVMPFLDWLNSSGIAKGKPVMLSEFGSNGPDQGSWYQGVGDLIAKTPQIKAAIEFDSNTGGCDTRVTASTDDWSGYADMAGSSYFNQNGS